MKIAEIREKNRVDLEKMVVARREEARRFRFQVAERETKNHQEYRVSRRDIARMLTVIRERSEE